MMVVITQTLNQERPHEALEQKTPATCYQSSPRIYPDRIPEPEYDSNMKPKRVYPDGTFVQNGVEDVVGHGGNPVQHAVSTRSGCENSSRQHASLW